MMLDIIETPTAWAIRWAFWLDGFLAPMICGFNYLHDKKPLTITATPEFEHLGSEYFLKRQILHLPIR